MSKPSPNALDVLQADVDRFQRAIAEAYEKDPNHAVLIAMLHADLRRARLALKTYKAAIYQVAA